MKRMGKEKGEEIGIMYKKLENKVKRGLILMFLLCSCHYKMVVIEPKLLFKWKHEDSVIKEHL